VRSSYRAGRLYREALEARERRLADLAGVAVGTAADTQDQPGVSVVRSAH
jgi:hypothetical protein